MQGIDFCIETNGENHHTSKYDLMTRPADRCLVVRRGQPFKLDILLNRPFDANKDAISFIFYVSGRKVTLVLYILSTFILRSMCTLRAVLFMIIAA